MSLRSVLVVAAAMMIAGAAVAQADPYELAVNGGFEDGTFAGWTVYGVASVVSPGYTGNAMAYLENTVAPSAVLIKNSNLGIGTVVGGETITINFDAMAADLSNGGVAFAEFFSEGTSGVTKSEILGGSPLIPLISSPNTWFHFSFTTTAAADVANGVTLQLTATTGAAEGSVAKLYYDNISVTVDRSTVPAQSTSWGRIKGLYR